jgi:hypothetical protein
MRRRRIRCFTLKVMTRAMPASSTAIVGVALSRSL